MYEYGLTHSYCDMRTIVFGYDFYDACKRHNLNPAEWEIDYSEYVD
jgi:hypothetical protein